MSNTQSSSDDETTDEIKHQMWGLSGNSINTADWTLTESKWLQDLYLAMIDTNAAKDNEGMKRTWAALVKQKVRLKNTCKTLLVSYLIIP